MSTPEDSELVPGDSPPAGTGIGRLLPSRESLYTLATTAWAQRHHVIITGPQGTGRTTFAQKVLGARRADVHRLAGARPLRDVPYAALASLTANAPSDTAALSPVGLMTALGAPSEKNMPRMLLLDDAQWIDERSAAAFAQAAGVGTVQLMMTCTDDDALPQSLRALALGDGI